MKVSLKKISAITGFSQATVSNALNNKRGVNRETASKIFQAARECGYNIETKISKIRLVMYSAGNQVVTDTPFFASLLHGVESECRENGYELTISRLQRRDGDYEHLLHQILHDSTSAILLLATELNEEDARRFEEAIVPVVFLDSWFAGLNFNSVLINNTDSVSAAVEWLIGKGHRRIGYLKSTTRIQNFRFRELGYMKALANYHLLGDSRISFALSPTMDGAYEDMLRHLETAPDMPTAFFADNDIIALGAMKAFQEKDYGIPEDISIVGFDDMPFCNISTPPLTTIRVFKHELGQTAVRRLIELLRWGDNFATKVQICNEFVERDSVRDLTGS